MVGSNVSVIGTYYYGTCHSLADAVLSWIGSGMKDTLVHSDKTTATYSTAVGFITVQKQEAKMIGTDWQKGEDARMEYEVVEDDSGIDWDDPDVIADVFEQTDTKLDKFFDKAADIMFGNLIHYLAFVVGTCFATLLTWHVIRWIW